MTMTTSSPPSLPPDQSPEDPRVSGIATVGWITLAALAICIPLSAVLKSSSALAAGALPLVIILGAGLMAVRIWSSGERLVNQKENEALRRQIAALEERLSNLEMIDSMEAHFAHKHGAPGPGGKTTMGPRPSSEESLS